MTRFNSLTSNPQLTPMPSTGLFNIKCAELSAKELDEICVTAVKAECLSCKNTISVEAGNGLETVRGGVIITCSGCGTRQAVSSSLFAGVTIT